VEDGVVVMLDFLNDRDALNVDDPESARLEAGGKKHAVGIAGQG
jgi:hypothetical protein